MTCVHAAGDPMCYSATRRYRHCLHLSCGYRWDRRIEEGLEMIGALATAQVRDLKRSLSLGGSIMKN
jgi:DNA-binding transcriptional MocR family regulator